MLHVAPWPVQYGFLSSSPSPGLLPLFPPPVSFYLSYLVLRNSVEREAGTLCPPGEGKEKKEEEEELTGYRCARARGEDTSYFFFFRFSSGAGRYPAKGTSPRRNASSELGRRSTHSDPLSPLVSPRERGDSAECVNCLDNAIALSHDAEIKSRLVMKLREIVRRVRSVRAARNGNAIEMEEFRALRLIRLSRGDRNVSRKLCDGRRNLEIECLSESAVR